MASQTRSLKIPGDLAEACEIRAKRLGYSSWGAYVKGLMRYDLMVNGHHQATLPVSKWPLVEQDKLDKELLEDTKKGIGKRGQFLRRFLQMCGITLPDEDPPPAK